MPLAKYHVPKIKRLCSGFWGLNHLTTFCPNLSVVLEPIRSLLCVDVDFVWVSHTGSGFVQAKSLVTAAPVLLYYDLSKPVVLQVDAMEYGMGGALLESNDKGELQPVAFTLCTLSRTERKYSQI